LKHNKLQVLWRGEFQNSNPESKRLGIKGLEMSFDSTNTGGSITDPSELNG
jgi:hypothetical protein